MGKNALKPNFMEYGSKCFLAHKILEQSDYLLRLQRCSWVIKRE